MPGGDRLHSKSKSWSGLLRMGLGISLYPSVKLQDVGAKCADYGVNATHPPGRIEKYDYIIVGGAVILFLDCVDI